MNQTIAPGRPGGLSLSGLRPADEELVRRSRAGEEEAFTLLVRRHQHQAFGMALRLLRDRWDADDVTQDAFVRAFQNLHRFNGDSTFGTWLGRIVLNRSLDALRRRQRVTGRLIEATGRAPGILEAAATVSDPASRPDGEAERLQLAEGFTRLLATLSAQQRVVFTLRHLEHRPTREVARLTGLNEGSVKTHLLRAIRKLRAGLKPFR